MRRLGTLATVAIVAIAAVTADCAVAPVPSEPAPRPSAASTAAPTDPSAMIRFRLDLVMPGGAELDALAARIADPASADYRGFLTPDEIGRRFGLPDAAIAATTATLSASGIAVVRGFRQRTGLVVEGPAAKVGALLGVRFEDVALPGGERVHQPVGSPTIPPALRSTVSAVEGLDPRLRAEPAQSSSDLPRRGLRPSDVATAYDFAQLRSQGIDGSGQTIAIVSFDTFRDEDVRAFDTAFGIHAALPERVPVAGAVSAGDGAVEVDLDVEVGRAIAPGATFLDFEAPNGNDFSSTIDAIVDDGRATLATVSWGVCEEAGLRQAIASEEPSFRRAAEVVGLTVFVASGDNGAYCGRSTNVADSHPSVAWPASSPYVVAVGGTNLRLRTDRTYLSEAGWEDPLSGGGTGGGASIVNARPSWQAVPAGAGGANGAGARLVPDVAGPADPDSGFVVFVTSDETGPSVDIVGGTSAAAPFWAATTALALEVRSKAGGGKLGFLAPLLYQLAAAGGSPAVFHDVTTGGNLADDAGPGWDPVTGLGSPDVGAYAQALAARR